jgi:hypothetical protein
MKLKESGFAVFDLASSDIYNALRKLVGVTGTFRYA